MEIKLYFGPECNLNQPARERRAAAFDHFKTKDTRPLAKRYMHTNRTRIIFQIVQNWAQSNKK